MVWESHLHFPKFGNLEMGFHPAEGDRVPTLAQGGPRGAGRPPRGAQSLGAAAPERAP